MILRRIVIDTFAGLSRRYVELQEGVNIVLGLNEAGKSTIFQAIQNVLLTPSNLGKREAGRMARFLPAGGGDTIGVELSFTDRGRPYRLLRRWGRSPAVELELPTGAKVTSEDGVAGYLAELLPAAPGTMREVLLARQSGLSQTLGALRQDTETVHSLSDLLRQAVLEMGGVSASRFRELVERKYRDAFRRWDRESGGPEGGRGIDRPWARDVGEVLAAYYNWKSLERSYQDAVAREDRFADAARELERLQKAVAEAQSFTDSHARAFQDAQRRRAVELELRESGREAALLKADYARWPALEKRLADLETAIPGLQARAQALKEERRAAEAGERQRRLLERLERVEARRAALRQAAEALRVAPTLERKDLERLRRLQAEMERRQAAAAGGRITLNLKSAVEQTLRVSQDGAPAREVLVVRGGELRVEGDAQIRLEHAEWSLEVASGAGDARRAAESLARARQELDEALAACGTASLEEAVERSEAWEALKAEEKRARSELEAELGGEDYEALARSAGAAGPGRPEEPPRPLAAVVEESLRAEQEVATARREQADAERELGRLRSAHGSAEALLDKIVAVRAAETALAAEAATLAPLPEGFADADQFLQAYREQETRLKTLREEAAGRQQEYYRAEADQPEESSEEILERARDAERAWQAARRKAEALAAIRSAVETVLEELDGDSSAGYREAMARYIGALTGNRYARVRMDDSLPDALLLEDGTPLTFDLLSGGTKDVFSLALRLAMAEFFLAGREGFLVMDDPLVELDPGRQEMAAGVLSGFCGEGRQLVLFTCHPLHAGLFDGAHLIELEKTAGRS